MSLPALPRAYRPVQRHRGLHLAHCRCRDGRHAPPVDERHAAFSVTWVQRGVFDYRSPAGQAVLGPGWLMLGNEGEGYTCSHEHSLGDGDDCLVLGLSGEAMDGVLEALGDAAGRRVFGRAALPPLPRVAALLQALLAEGDEGFALEEAALAVVGQVRRTLLARGEAPAPRPTRRQADLALAAARAIEQRAAEPLSLDAIAGVVGVSAFHLMRLFRDSLGVTPHQYLIRMRLLHAVRLLGDTTRPVTDIAYETGWQDLSNFIRSFRREMGCSPRAFRRGDRGMLGLTAPGRPGRAPAPSA